jgi:hypothetical protein
VERCVQHVVAEAFPGAPDHIVPDGWEDFRSAVHVQVADLAGGFSGCQAESNDSPGRGPGNKIEVVGDAIAGADQGFQVGENGCRENSADATAIDREDAKVPVRRPTLRNAAPRNGAGDSAMSPSGFLTFSQQTARPGRSFALN